MKRIRKEIKENLKKKWNDIKKKIKENKVRRYAKKIDRLKEHLSKLEHAYKLEKECEESNREYYERNSLKSIISDRFILKKQPSDREIRVQDSIKANVTIMSPKDEKPGTIVILPSDENQYFTIIVAGKYICKWEANTEDLEDKSITYRKEIYENKLKKNKIFNNKSIINYLFNAYLKRDLYYERVNEDDIKSIISYIDSSQFRKPQEDEDDGSGTGVRSKK